MEYFKVVNPNSEHESLRDRAFHFLAQQNKLIIGRMARYPRWEYVFFLEEIIEIEEKEACADAI